jgi:hypothetical protein
MIPRDRLLKHGYNYRMALLRTIDIVLRYTIRIDIA